MEDEENEQRKNVPKDDGTLALGIDFGTCRISSQIWNKNKKGTQIVKDPNKKNIYFPAFIFFDKERDYGIPTKNEGISLPSQNIEEEKKEENNLYQIIDELKEYPSNPGNIVYNIKQILGQKYNLEY